MNLSSCQCVKYQSLIPNNSDMAKRRNHLLPDRHPQQDLFVCDIVDAAPKADMGSMEHPIFSLSTKPDLKVREYHHGENFIKITPSVKGLATVFDRDILIYCISQCMAALNEGREVCLLYTSPSPRDGLLSRMPSSA